MHKSHTSLALLFAGAAAVFSTTSQAADMQYFAPVPATIYGDAGLTIATEAWTGFYAGATIGARKAGNFEFEVEEAGITGGGQLGYLQQFGMLVVGAEIQGLWMDELHYALTPDAGLTQNWSVAAKGRAGVALGETLIYATGGAILADLQPAGGTSSERAWQTGAVFGGGVEQKLSDNLSIRAEYLQTRFFDVDSAVGGVGRTDNLENHVVSVGLNYSF